MGYNLSDLIDKDDRGAQPAIDRVALTFGSRDVTYRELRGRAAGLAEGLRRAGVGEGDRVCVLMRNRIEWVELFFAAAAIGAVVVPANFLLIASEVAFILDDSGASVLVADGSCAEIVRGIDVAALAAAPRLVRVGQGWDGDAGVAGAAGAGGGLDGWPDPLDFEELVVPGIEPRWSEVPVQAPFLIQYTSGTTGFPKGAVQTQSSVLWNAFSQQGHFGISSETVYLGLPALCWVAGFHSLMLETLWSGGRVVLGDSAAGFDPAAFCALVEREGVTAVALVPTLMRRLLNSGVLGEHDLGSLRTVITGGEPASAAVLEQMGQELPGLDVLQVYGMSEFPSLATVLEARFAHEKIGSAGRANAVTRMRVVDAAGTELGPGEIGEITLRSPAMLSSYWGNPEATAAAIRSGWFHTGDLGYLDADGFLFISGRSKDVIITGGLNVYPVEVENVLLELPEVTECAVIGRRDESWGEVVTAVVVLAAGSALTEDELAGHLAGRVARFKLPKRWEIRSGAGVALPRTASGKLQKFKLL